VVTVVIPSPEKGARVDDIETVRARLEVTDLAADGVAGLLEAAWHALGLVIAVSGECQDRSAELYAAFSFASAVAAAGRLVLWAAPSLPRTCGWETGHEMAVAEDLEDAADALARLADVLTTRLSSAGRDTEDPADRGACADAARQAGEICRLLARGPS
jgi:hypothetical protein